MPSKTAATDERITKLARGTYQYKCENRKYFEILLKKFSELRNFEETLHKSIGLILFRLLVMKEISYCTDETPSMTLSKAPISHVTSPNSSVGSATDTSDPRNPNGGSVPADCTGSGAIDNDPSNDATGAKNHNNAKDN